MSQLPISNIISISVSQGNPGANAYNTSNICLFSTEAPSGWSNGQAYAQYLTPTQVGIDFGTNSKTYLMAVAIFSQQPNLIIGGGQLIVYPLATAVQNLAFSGVAASGSFVFNYGGHASAAINYNDTASQIQTKLQAVSGLSEVTVSGSISSESLNVTYNGVYGVLSLATFTSNTLQTAGSSAITITATTTTAGQTWSAAITASANTVQYFGHAVTANLTEIGGSDLAAAATTNQALVKLGFVVSNSTADIQPGGAIDLLRSGSETQMRGLYYGDSSENNDIAMMAAFMSRGLSTNFNGSNTTQSMFLKVLAGVQPDPSMTQTILGYMTASGADGYVSWQGVAGCTSNGANTYFDQIYGTLWLTGALQIAGFNYLAQTANKIPQTESGMDGLKGAYRQVCQLAVTNQFAAPGSWNSPTTFGNPTDLINNVAQIGYYIYSLPINQQLQTARAARQAPLCQIAMKLAGAIQQSTVIVTVNP